MRAFAPWILAAFIGSVASACRAEAPSASPSPDEAAPSAAKDEHALETKGTVPDDRDQVDPDGVVRRGKPLSPGEPIAVDEAWARADALDGQRVMITGLVDRVCRKKGCWMAITAEDGDRPIRVTFEDYGFFVPRESPGMVAVVEGELALRTLDVETAQHYENDRVEGTDEKPKTITEPKRELAIVASALELRQL